MEDFWEIVKDWAVILLKVYGCLLIVQTILFIGSTDYQIPYVYRTFIVLKDFLWQVKEQVFGIY